MGCVCFWVLVVGCWFWFFCLVFCCWFGVFWFGRLVLFGFCLVVPGFYPNKFLEILAQFCNMCFYIVWVLTSLFLIRTIT